VSQSLRDQLVKAGLATSAQAKKAERSKRAEATSKRHQTKAKKGKGATTSQSDTAKVKAKAAQQRAERAAKDKALAQQHNEKAQAKALQAQIRQLILQNDQRTKVADDDAVPYNFVHGKKIKKIFVTKQQLEALSSGRLVVVNNNGIYHFVDEKVAKQIEQRDPKRIIVAHDANAKPPEPGSDEEFYAKFEVPDDLDW
jgi:uncharacterized protein YaiL (DUF2058 family)